VRKTKNEKEGRFFKLNDIILQSNLKDCPAIKQ
jgi:hypothetical protein